MAIFEEWCEFECTDTDAKRLWSLEEKDGGRAAIREGLIQAVRSHYDDVQRIADDIHRLGYDGAAAVLRERLPRMQVTVFEAVEDKEKALAKYPDLFARYAVEDIIWSDDLAAAQAKAIAEHIAAHPEDAGRTVADFRWIVREIVLQPQEIIEQPQELIEDEHAAKDTDEDAAVSETPDLNVLSTLDLDCSARS